MPVAEAYDIIGTGRPQYYGCCRTVIKSSSESGEGLPLSMPGQEMAWQALAVGTESSR